MFGVCLIPVFHVNQRHDGLTKGANHGSEVKCCSESIGTYSVGSDYTGTQNVVGWVQADEHTTK